MNVQPIPTPSRGKIDTTESLDVAMCNDHQMDAKVTPLHPEDDEVSEDLVGNEEWLSAEQE